MLRLLRDSTLLAWVLIVSGLLIVLGIARGVGENHQMPVLGDNTKVSVVAAQASKAATAVEQLRGLAPAGIAAASDPAALTSWAQQVNATATAGASVRASEGADGSDQLAATLADITAGADTLSREAGNAVAAASDRTRLLMLIDRATSLVNGMPVPGQLPEVAGDPFGDPTSPAAPTPSPRTPPTATPKVAPSAGPTLNLTKPDPKDLR